MADGTVTNRADYGIGQTLNISLNPCPNPFSPDTSIAFVETFNKREKPQNSGKITVYTTLVQDQTQKSKATGVGGNLDFSYGPVSGDANVQFAMDNIQGSLDLTMVVRANQAGRRIKNEIPQIESLKLRDSVLNAIKNDDKFTFEEFQKRYGSYLIIGHEYGGKILFESTYKTKSSEDKMSVAGGLSVSFGKMGFNISGSVEGNYSSDDISKSTDIATSYSIFPSFDDDIINGPNGIIPLLKQISDPIGNGLNFDKDDNKENVYGNLASELDAKMQKLLGGANLDVINAIILPIKNIGCVMDAFMQQNTKTHTVQKFFKFSNPLYIKMKEMLKGLETINDNYDKYDSDNKPTKIIHEWFSALQKAIDVMDQIIGEDLYIFAKKRYDYVNDINQEEKQDDKNTKEINKLFYKIDVRILKNEFQQDVFKPFNTMMKNRAKSKKQAMKGYISVPNLDKLSTSKQHRTIMVIGATGTGKTTTLNCMMNYLWDVKYHDKYRYKLIFEPKKQKGQADSQTDNVTAYHLAPPILDYELTVIDTPGFGDTRGVERDKLITKNIKEFFEKEVQDIDAVCFVIRAPQARLTATQKYIFAQVLNIFGKDIEDNIFILLTFADGKKPPALAALKAGNIPFKKSWKLNNSAYELADEKEYKSTDDSDDEDDTREAFWKITMKTFGKLFRELSMVQTKSLRLTKAVLTKREQLENYVESIKPTIDAGFSVLDNMRQQIIYIKKYGDLVNANKDFMIPTQVTTAKQIPNGGSCTTTCITCNYTCHKSCALKDDNQKRKCCAMDKSGNCTACPGKCCWNIHRNLPYTVVYKTETVQKPIKDLKDRYYNAKNNQETVQQQLHKGLTKDLTDVAAKLGGLIDSVRECINELSKIALRPNVLSQDDYMDKLIQTEKLERKPGWKKRCESLQQLKEQQNMVNSIGKKGYNPFKDVDDDVKQYVQQNKEIASWFQ